MPNFSGGDITEIVCKHELGTFRFQTKSNESYTLDPGGFRANDDANAITGAGEMIDQVNRVRWMLEGPVAVDMASENEVKNLPALSASPELGVWTIAHINGTIWKGRGKPVGDLNFDTNTAQMPLKVSGSGVLEKL